MSSKDGFIAVIPEDSLTEEEVSNSLKNGVIPNNALSWAAENGHVEIVKLLKEV